MFDRVQEVVRENAWSAASLARLEGFIGLRTILQRLPEIRLAVPVEELAWRPGIITFALEKLPVRF